MKLYSLLFIFLLPLAKPGDLNSTGLLKKMHAKYHGKWHQTLAFNQTTEVYKNDSLFKKQTWFERILYPDKLRIDFDSLKSGSGVIFRADSTYVFNKNKIGRSIRNENELIFFLGGMYAESIDKVLAHFKDLHYDLEKFHEDIWKGNPVYVIGAERSDEKVNQLWIDQENLLPVRFIKYENNTREEGTFEDHIKLKGGWSETLCKFWINDKLVQVEKYHDIVAGVPLDKNIFEPGLIGK